MRRRDVLETVVGGTTAMAAGCVSLRSVPDASPSIAWEYDVPNVQTVEADGTHAVVATERELVALARSDGTVAWRHRDESLTHLDRDEHRYYAYGPGGVVALDRSNGDVRWRVDGSYQRLHPAASAVVCYTSSGRETVGFDPATGDRLWTWEGNMIYTYGPTFGLVPGSEYRGFDLNEGTVEWTFRDGDGQTLVAVADGRVVVMVYDDSGSTLVALDRDSGAERWRYDVSGGPYSSGSVIDGTVYVSVYDETPPARLHAIDLESGRHRWTTTVRPDFDVSSVTPVSRVGETVIVDVSPSDPLSSTCGVDIETGTIEWIERDREVVTTDDDRIVLEADGGDFFGVRPDGSIDWEGGMEVVVQYGSTISDEAVYWPPEIVTLEESFVAAFAGSNGLEAWDITTGTRHWRHTFEETIDSVFSTHGDAYVATDGTLFAVLPDG